MRAQITPIGQHLGPSRAGRQHVAAQRAGCAERMGRLNGQRRHLVSWETGLSALWYWEGSGQDTANHAARQKAESQRT